MVLQSIYSRYLASPTADALAADASIHYLPTLSSINKPAAILKHHAAQDQLLINKANVLNAIESGNGLCLETESTITFLNGGGTYLPGLEANFIVDKTVTLPITHIVAFDEQQKIKQIRILWDQGSLLKGMDVIGSRGRNWPVSDGKDQIRILADSVDLAGSASGGEEERSSRRPARAGTNGDKHTSHALGQPKEPAREESPAHSLGPRASAKPPPRDYHDLFAGGSNLPRSPSPTKSTTHKAGAGKNYHGNRLFDEEPEDLTSPTKKTDVKKYKHFEFGDAEDSTPRPISSKNSKHGPQWNFEDFVTPQKASSKARDPNERQFGWSDDEEEASRPIVHRPKIPQARPDAVTHFDFNDEATPTQERQRPSSSRATNNAKNSALYEDHVLTNDDGTERTGGTKTDEKMPLGNITNQTRDQAAPIGNTNKSGHQKTFSSQFDIRDDVQDGDSLQPKSENIPEPRKKVAKVMQANWEMRDDSPRERGINIQGDGMGSRKVPGEKHWWEYE